MKKKLIGYLMGSPTALGVALCFISTWITLNRIENKIDEIRKRIG